MDKFLCQSIFHRILLGTMNAEIIFIVVALLLSILGLMLVSCLALFYRQRSATCTEGQCHYGRKRTYHKLIPHLSGFSHNSHNQMPILPCHIYRTYAFLETQPPSPYTLHLQQLYTPPYYYGPEIGPRRVADGTPQSPIATGLYEPNVQITRRFAELET